jgi:hypothetical protein
MYLELQQQHREFAALHLGHARVWQQHLVVLFSAQPKGVAGADAARAARTLLT